MKIRWMLLGLMLIANVLFGQERAVHVRFQLSYAGEPIELEKDYLLPEGEKVTFENLRFYVSEMQLWNAGQKVEAFHPRHLLVDVEDVARQSFHMLIGKGVVFDQLQFQLGIDSLTNVSGALGGDLDPTKGMYWAWQSGYINFKLEGKTNVCPARNHFFQFHLGGYLPPFYGLQRVALPVKQDGKEIVVVLAVDEILAGIDLGTTYEVMSPSEKAVGLAVLVSRAFRVQGDGE
jgi:hypothetical protein